VDSGISEKAGPQYFGNIDECFARWSLWTPELERPHKQVRLAVEAAVDCIVFTGIEESSLLYLRWAKDDSFISFSGGPSLGTVGSEVGIYSANVDWSGGDPVLTSAGRRGSVILHPDGRTRFTPTAMIDIPKQENSTVGAETLIVEGHLDRTC
jgi:hypothetical protein